MAGQFGGYIQSQGGGGGGGVNNASGAITSGTLGPNTVYSGNIASGQVSKYAFASGTTVDSAEWLIDDTFATAERISGGGEPAAVAFTQSGTLQTAMASVSGRMPAIGVVVANVVSGGTATVYRNGRLFSTAFNYSGWANQPVYVGRSGQCVASGASTSSGDVQQILGISISASGIFLQPGDALEGVVAGSGDIGSGSVTGQAGGGNFCVASGSLSTYDFASGATVRAAQFVTVFSSGTAWPIITEEAISGVRAVCISQSGNLRIAMASVSGRMPAIGVVVDNVASGISGVVVYTQGAFQVTSGLANYSGYLGKPVWVGPSGHVVTFSGSFNSGGFNAASGGDFVQRFGVCFNSGAFIVTPDSTLLQNQLLGVNDLVDVVNRGFGV